MNVQLMQMVQVKKPEAPEVPKPTTNNKNESFGTMFNKVVNQQKAPEKTASAVEPAEETGAVLKAENVKELLDILGLQEIDGLILLDDKLISVEELMGNLSALLQLVNLDEQDLQRFMVALTNQQDAVEDVWALLSALSTDDSGIQSKLSAMLQGEHAMTPKEANQFVAMLKFMQVAAKDVDLTSMQEGKLQSLSTLLENVVTTMTKTSTETKAALPFETKAALPFEHLLTQAKSEVKPTGQEALTQNTIQTRPNTFQVTLPQAQPGQSEALLKEMQAIINKAQISQNQGVTRLMIKLYPENLGTLRVELVQQNGILTARMLASTAAGREMIDNQLHQLKQAFVQQGLQVERIDVGQTLQDTDRNNREQQGFFNQFFKRQQQEQENKKEQKEQQSFEEFLANEEV